MSNVNANSSDRCVLCLDQKRSPVHIQCGHSFCCGCLKVYKTYRKYPWANKCPICRDVLMEKKRTSKRRYSEISSTTPNRQGNSFLAATETLNNTNLASNLSMPQEQIIILEEFMALATNNDDENFDNQNSNLNNYDEDSVDDFTEEDEEEGEQQHQPQYIETEHLTNEGDSYREQDDQYSDTEIDDNEEYDIDFDDDDGDYDDEEYDNDHNYYFNEENLNIRPRRSVGNYQSNYYDRDDVMEVINVDDDSYVEDVEWFSTNSNNLTNLNNFPVDWESVIASDVIIID